MRGGYNTTWNIGGGPYWVPIAMLAAGLVLDLVDIWWTRPAPARQPVTISAIDCWALCDWSDRPMAQWTETSCACGPK
jgi:hypothetical protein